MTTDKLKFAARAFCLALCAIAATASAARAQAQADKTLSPYFFVQGDPNVDRLPLKDTRVEIAVSGVIADVTVVQTYRNEGSRPINASYVFPASTRAALYAMRMKIGDRIIVASKRSTAQTEDKLRFVETGADGGPPGEPVPGVVHLVFPGTTDEKNGRTKRTPKDISKDAMALFDKIRGK